MNNLLLAESRRFWSRRMTRFFPISLAALFVVGVGLALAIVLANDTDVDFVTDIADGPGATAILGPIGSLLPVMAFVIGASFIGADIKTGMLEQILTWEPRRVRLLAGRTVVVIGSVAVIAMALAAFLVALLFALAAVTGTVSGTTGELWGNIGLNVARTGLASGVFCAFGLGVTLLVNNSIGSIVGFVIYWFIVENVVLSAFLPRVAVYMPVTNASAFAQGTPVERVSGSLFGGEFDVVEDHSYLAAGAILVAWAALSLALAAVAFQRRDID